MTKDINLALATPCCLYLPPSFLPSLNSLLSFLLFFPTSHLPNSLLFFFPSCFILSSLPSVPFPPSLPRPSSLFPSSFYLFSLPSQYPIATLVPANSTGQHL